MMMKYIHEKGYVGPSPRRLLDGDGTDGGQQVNIEIV